MLGYNLYSPEMVALGDRYRMPRNWQFIVKAQMEDALAKQCYLEVERRWEVERDRITNKLT